MSRVVPFVALVLLGALGCSQAGQPSARDDIQTLLLQLPALAEDAAAWPNAFANGAAPSDSERPKYALLSYHVLDAKLDRKEAIARVSIEDNERHKIGELDWKLIKEKGAWKLKHAPLP